MKSRRVGLGRGGTGSIGVIGVGAGIASTGASNSELLGNGAVSSALRDACLSEFTRPGAPGGCFECHSIDADGAGRLTINWSGRDRLDERRGFTRFSHRPHVLQPELSDCSHCHQIDPSKNQPETYTGTDPTRFASEFVAIKKADCISCHKPHAAGDSCTQCHNYHVESFATGLGKDDAVGLKTSSGTRPEPR